ncbi:MAG: hypothetical protein AAF485_18840 [Chloroflexota bacterium]
MIEPENSNGNATINRTVDYLARFDIAIFFGITIFGLLFFFRFYAGTAFSLGLAEILTISILIPLIFSLTAYRTKASLQLDEKIELAEAKIAAAPEKARPAWDLARVTLEAYFNRNLSQINYIFWLSVFVMLVGFGIIVWGISQAIQNPDTLLVAAITGIAGIVTEFIGATFLFVYRSTMKQASSYSATLERMNSVGMAMQILDTIPNDAKPDDLKNQTKAALVEMLILGTHNTQASERNEAKQQID